jgi:hypothetical protein
MLVLAYKQFESFLKIFVCCHTAKLVFVFIGSVSIRGRQWGRLLIAANSLIVVIQMYVNLF